MPYANTTENNDCITVYSMPARVATKNRQPKTMSEVPQSLLESTARKGRIYGSNEGRGVTDDRRKAST